MIIFRLITLILKELQILARNKATLVLLVLPVFFQSLIFPFAATLELNNTTIAIFDEAQTDTSIEISQRIAASSVFTHVIPINNEDDLINIMDNQKVLIAVRFPHNFGQQSAQIKNEVQIIADGRRANSAQIAFSYVVEIILNISEEKNMGQGLIALSPRHFYNPNLNFKWFILPSLVAIIATVGCLTVTALSLAREREEGTYDQLLVSPLTPLYIMVGKAIPAVIVAIVQGTIITLVAIFIYQLPFKGSIGLHYLTLAIYALSLTGFGLFVSSLCHTQQQALLGVFFFMIPAIVLSGFMSPIENMPPILYWLTHGNPLTHYIIIVKGIFLKGFTFTDVWPNLWPLMLISVVMSCLAYFFFKRNI